MKKLLLTFLLLSFTLILSACDLIGGGTIDDILEDPLPPVILGANDVTINVGDTFNPLDGVTATDIQDGDITSSLTVSGTVDVNTPDVYVLTYSVSNSANLSATVNRSITVVDPNAGGDDDDDDDDDDDPITDPNEVFVDNVISSWSGDLSYLNPLMSQMGFDNGLEMETVMTISYTDPYDGMVMDAVVTMTERYYDTVESGIMERIIVMDLDGEEEAITFHLIFVMSGSSITLYLDISRLYPELGTEELFFVNELFNVNNDWVKFTYDDSLANMVELEAFKAFIEGVLKEQLPELNDFDMIETELLALIGADETLANVELELIFNALMDWDVNQAVAYAFDINYTHLIESAEASALRDEIIYTMELYESELRTANFDYDTYYATLTTDGVFALLDTMTLTQANILGTVLDAPIGMLVESYQNDTLIEDVLLFIVEEGEVELSSIPGLDYDALHLYIETIDLIALRNSAEIFDYNTMITELFMGDYHAYFEALPESEFKTLLSLFQDMIFENMRALGAILEYQTLLNDFDRFNPYFSMHYFGSHELMDMTLTKTETLGLEANMAMSHEMLIAFTQEFLSDVWFFIDQLDAVTLPLVDPINCDGAVDCEYFTELDMIYQMLEGMDPMEMALVIENPWNPDTIEMHMDLVPLFDHLALQTEGVNPFTTLSMDMTITGGVTPNALPTVYDDLNLVAEEIARVVLLTEMGQLLQTIKDEMDLGAFEDGTYTLNDFTGIYESVGIFDKDLTTFTLTEGVLTAEFFWIDGAMVLDAPITLDTLNAYDYDAPASRSDVVDYIALVNEETFTMTRLLLLFFSYGVYDDMYGYEDPYYFDNPYYYLPMLYEYSEFPIVGQSYPGEYWAVLGYSSYCDECYMVSWDVEDAYFMWDSQLVGKLYAFNYGYAWETPTIPFTDGQMFLAIYQGDQLIEVYNDDVNIIIATLYNLAYGTYTPMS